MGDYPDGGNCIDCTRVGGKKGSKYCKEDMWEIDENGITYDGDTEEVYINSMSCGYFNGRKKKRSPIIYATPINSCNDI